MVCLSSRPSDDSWSCNDKIFLSSITICIVSVVALTLIFSISNYYALTRQTLLYSGCPLGTITLITFVSSVLSRRYLSTASDMPDLEDGFKVQLFSCDRSLVLPNQQEAAQILEKLASAERSSLPSLKYYAGREKLIVVEYEGWIIKQPSLRTSRICYPRRMLQNILSSQTIVDDNRLTTCTIPKAITYVPEKHRGGPDDDYSSLIMQKLHGPCGSMAQEVSEREFEQFAKNLAIKEKWKKYFEDAAHFICLAHYWDTDWRNIVLMEDGFGFIDYEDDLRKKLQIEDNNRILGDPAQGISGLLQMAHPDFFPMIWGIAEARGITIGQQYYDWPSREQRERELAFRSALRRWHSKNAITHATEIQIVETMSPEVKKIIGALNTAFRASNPDASLIDRRTHTFNKDVIKRENLDLLKKNNAIMHWEERGDNKYIIYF